MGRARSRIRRASATWPRSARAPASTMVISMRRAGSSGRRAASLASFRAFCGRPKRALAVGHDREVVIGAGHPPQGPELAQRHVIAAGGVRGLGRRLADDGQPSRTTTGGLGVRVRQLGLLVDQLAGQHQVARDDLGQVLGQAAQLGPDGAVQGPGVDIGRQGRLVRRPGQAGTGRLPWRPVGLAWTVTPGCVGSGRCGRRGTHPCAGSRRTGPDLPDGGLSARARARTGRRLVASTGLLTPRLIPSAGLFTARRLPTCRLPRPRLRRTRATRTGTLCAPVCCHRSILSCRNRSQTAGFRHRRRQSMTGSGRRNTSGVATNGHP